MIQRLAVVLVTIYYLDPTCDVIPLPKSSRHGSSARNPSFSSRLEILCCAHGSDKSTVSPSVLGCGPNRPFGVYSNIFVLFSSFFVLLSDRHIGLPDDLKRNGAKIRLRRCD